MIEKLQTDSVVGRMIHHNLQVQVSVRGSTIVLQYYNRETHRGFEVAFTPTAAEELNDIVNSAVKVARGIG